MIKKTAVRKVIYSLTALFSMPVISLIAFFIIPMLLGGAEMTNANKQLNHIIMFLFVTVAVYFVITFLVKIIEQENQWREAKMIFWIYFVISGILTLMYYLNIIDMILTPHLFSFSAIFGFVSDIVKNNFTASIASISWGIFSPVIIYILLYIKFKPLDKNQS